MKRFMQITLIMILVLSSTMVVQGKPLDSQLNQTPPRKVFLPHNDKARRRCHHRTSNR